MLIEQPTEAFVRPIEIQGESIKEFSFTIPHITFRLNMASRTEVRVVMILYSIVKALIWMRDIVVEQNVN